jgi:hypothetical protein
VCGRGNGKPGDANQVAGFTALVCLNVPLFSYGRIRKRRGTGSDERARGTSQIEREEATQAATRCGRLLDGLLGGAQQRD